MSLEFRIQEQVLKIEDSSDEIEAIVHKYDAFLDLICPDEYEFQKEAVRTVIRYMISQKYENLELLARENWGESEAIRQRHIDVDAFTGLMPLKDFKSASLDLATGTGKSYVMYAIAAIALAEDLVDRVLVLCPSLTIEEGLLDKFTGLASNREFSEIMEDLGASVSIPAIKRGNETIKAGDICIENVHAVYEKTGSSIRDSFKGNGSRSLVLNDEAHHLFSAPDTSLKKWMEFLQDKEFGFSKIVNVTGTPYIGDIYFPDVIYRYGLKQAIEDKVVKKPNYKEEDTLKEHNWQQTYAIHQKNRKDYGHKVKPITIIVTSDIAGCVHVWRELVEFLAKKEKISVEEAQKKVIWVTSSVPTSGKGKAIVNKAFLPRSEKDSPDKTRKDNLAMLKKVDDSDNEVEWIVSVSMLTEGWDVKNVFQIVPHESRAFNSKLLIAQVLGRGLRVPPSLDQVPFVTINNHEAWTEGIRNLLKEVLEVESTLSSGYDQRRESFVFPLYNIKYEPEQIGVQAKRERAREPDVKFRPQAKRTTEHSKFSMTGRLAVEIEHDDFLTVDDAVKAVRLFIKGKDETLAKKWTKAKLRKFIVDRLKRGGYDSSYLSKENLLLLQHGFSPMFRDLDKEHPRISQVGKDLLEVDLRNAPLQSFSESSLKNHGSIYTVDEDKEAFTGLQLPLWEQYQRFKKQYSEYGEEAADAAKAIGSRIHQIDLSKYKSPWNIHYASFEPERKFSDLLFEEAELFDSFVKMPHMGLYSFPYSYKPSKTGKTHVKSDNFNPDFFIKLADKKEVLVVEIKDDEDDSNKNRAKYRDGVKHFEVLNEKLKDAGEDWVYHFYFLSPDDYTQFFSQVREAKHAGWKSGLMQELEKN